MSEQGPDDATQSFEYLGDAPEQPEATEQGAPRGRRGRRTLIGLTVGAVVVAGGAGAFAVAQFLDGGPSAASAAPADAMAFLSLDLDPGGGQKVAAYRTLKKFPALEKNLGLTSQDDLRSWVFEGITSDSGCKDVTFSDVEPWLGSAMGVGAIPGKEEPTVFFSLEVTDQDKAAAGAKELAACLDEDEVGTAFAGDFMIVAEDAGKAEDIAQSAQESSLADDPTYQARTGEAGDDGVVTGYLAPSFGDFLADQLSSFGGSVQSSSASGEATMAGRAGVHLDETTAPSPSGEPAPEDQLTEDAEPGTLPSDFPTEEPGDYPSDYPSDFPEGEGGLDDMPMGPMGPMGMGMGLPGLLFGGMGGLGDLDKVTDQLADFGGAAMQVRFADESLEVEMSSKGIDTEVADSGGVSLGDLPDDTGLAFGLATGDSWAEQLVKSMRSAEPDGFDRAMEEGSAETGLSLPEDLQTLVGDSVAVSVDSSVDFPKLFESFFLGSDGGDPLELGVRITGDAEEIAPIAQKLADYASKEDGPQVVVSEGDGAVAIGFDQDYVDRLAKGGDLAGSKVYEQALPDDGDALVGAFADFDANGWLDKAMESSSAEDRANAEPLSALGLTMDRDGDSLHATLRLTTD